VHELSDSGAHLTNTLMDPGTFPDLAVASQQFLKGAAPSWEDGTPFYTGPNPDDVEKAHRRFIKEASALLRQWPRSPGLRAVATNFQVCATIQS
jgi:hypothetical protein